MPGKENTLPVGSQKKTDPRNLAYLARMITGFGMEPLERSIYHGIPTKGGLPEAVKDVGSEAVGMWVDPALRRYLFSKLPARALPHVTKGMQVLKGLFRGAGFGYLLGNQYMGWENPTEVSKRLAKNTAHYSSLPESTKNIDTETYSEIIDKTKKLGTVGSDVARDLAEWAIYLKSGGSMLLPVGSGKTATYLSTLTPTSKGELKALPQALKEEAKESAWYKFLNPKSPRYNSKTYAVLQAARERAKAFKLMYDDEEYQNLVGTRSYDVLPEDEEKYWLDEQGNIKPERIKMLQKRRERLLKEQRQKIKENTDESKKVLQKARREKAETGSISEETKNELLDKLKYGLAGGAVGGGLGYLWGRDWPSTLIGAAGGAGAGLLLRSLIPYIKKHLNNK